jgi:hypothetical protein
MGGLGLRRRLRLNSGRAVVTVKRASERSQSNQSH